MTTATKYSDRSYRAKAAALRKATSDNGWPCHLCGKPIDMSLPTPSASTQDHASMVSGSNRFFYDRKHGTVSSDDVH